MRLLCDEMLIRLCRWLRAAGYDTALASPGTADRELMRQVVAERRLLLTRDREFLERREAHRHVLLLDSTDLERQAAQLRVQLGIDWLYRPFSRCLLCNAPLCPAAAEQRPPGVTGEVLACCRCDKIYWEGAHVRHMRERLRNWAVPK